MSPEEAMMPEKVLLLYVDNSNIFIEGKKIAGRKGENELAFRLYFKNFLYLVLQKRSASEIVWGGSIPPETDDLWDALRELGVQPDLIRRSETGENETVDHLIQLKMFRHVREYRAKPGTIVLCTGDGAGYAERDGFLYDLEGHEKDGWKVEVFSWTHSCSRRLRDFAARVGTFHPLDAYYNAITYIEGGRQVQAR